MRQRWWRWMSALVLIVGIVGGSGVVSAQSLDERGYVLFIPDDYDEEQPTPLVIGLHGFGDTAQNFAENIGFNQVANDAGVLVVYPNGWQRQWNDGSQGDHSEDDTQLLLDLIAELQADYTIDEERIYLMGFSNGGSMVFKAHCDAPGTFAAVASIGGSMRAAQAANCPDDALTSVLVMHSVADNVVDFWGGNGKFAAPRAAVQWVEHNACETTNVPPFQPDAFDDITGTMTYYFPDCAAGTQVLLHIFEDLPHAWAGALERTYGLFVLPERDASAIVWRFFSEVTLPDAAADPEATADPETTPEAP